MGVIEDVKLADYIDHNTFSSFMVSYLPREISFVFIDTMLSPEYRISNEFYIYFMNFKEIWSTEEKRMRWYNELFNKILYMKLIKPFKIFDDKNLLIKMNIEQQSRDKPFEFDDDYFIKPSETPINIEKLNKEIGIFMTKTEILDLEEFNSDTILFLNNMFIYPFLKNNQELLGININEFFPEFKELRKQLVTSPYMNYVNQYIIELQLYRDTLKDYFPQDQHLIEDVSQINGWIFSKSQTNRVYENNIIIMKNAIHNYLEASKQFMLYDGECTIPNEYDKINNQSYLHNIIDMWKFIYDGILLMNILLFFKQSNKLSENNYNYSYNYSNETSKK